MSRHKYSVTKSCYVYNLLHRTRLIRKKINKIIEFKDFFPIRISVNKCILSEKYTDTNTNCTYLHVPNYKFQLKFEISGKDKMY